MRRTALALPLAAVAAAAALTLPSPASAQPQPDRRVVAVEQDQPQSAGTVIVQDAAETRERFRELLQSHPPALARILKLDPQLMTAETYLTPYPAVAQFLKNHPEVTRNPNYFLSFVDSWGNIEVPVAADVQARREAINAWSNTFDAVLFLAGFSVALVTLTWLVRTVIGHRRWLRTSKTQSDVHGRLLERFSSNEDLMAYVQSPAGRQFLTAMPMLDVSTHAASPLTAPFGRILWAVQAGLVLVSGGVGLLVIRDSVIPEIGDTLLTLGVLAISLGVGFALASLASYLISRRMGLIEPKSAPPSGS